MTPFRVTALLVSLALGAFAGAGSAAPTVELTIERHTATEGDVVTVRDRDVARSGDGLRFEVRVDEPAYVYLLARGSSGRVVALHPYGGARAPAFESGQRMQIPRDGSFLPLDEQPGPEIVLAFATEAPVDNLAAWLATLEKVATVDELREAATKRYPAALVVEITHLPGYLRLSDEPKRVSRSGRTGAEVIAEEPGVLSAAGSTIRDLIGDRPISSGPVDRREGESRTRHRSRGDRGADRVGVPGSSSGARNVGSSSTANSRTSFGTESTRADGALGRTRASTSALTTNPPNRSAPAGITPAIRPPPDSAATSRRGAGLESRSPAPRSPDSRAATSQLAGVRAPVSPPASPPSSQPRRAAASAASPGRVSSSAGIDAAPIDVHHHPLAGAVVLVVTSDGAGTGVVVNDGREVLTSWHLVDGQASVSVVPRGTAGVADLARVLPARVVRINTFSDLALLRVEQAISRQVLDVVSAGGIPGDGAQLHVLSHDSRQAWRHDFALLLQAKEEHSWFSGTVIHRAPALRLQMSTPPAVDGAPVLDRHGKLVGLQVSSRRGAVTAVAPAAIRAFLGASDQAAN